MTATTLDTVPDYTRETLFTGARTVNNFADIAVTDEELRSVWDLARFSPTMANSQPLRVLFVRTPEGKERLAPHLAEGNRAKSASAPVVAVLAYDSDFHEQFPVTFPARGEAMREQFGSMPEEDRGDVAKYSAALATGVLLLAIRSHGLAAGPMAGFDAAGVDEEFFAGTSWRSHLVLNIGHPGENPFFDRLPRVDVEDALAWA